MLIDEVTVTFCGGHGGAGKVSFYPGLKSGPDGGNGGRGGDVYIKVTSDLFALNQFSKSKVLTAGNGEMGGKNRKFGKDGDDLIITLPIGTQLTDENNQIINLERLDQVIKVASGGLGGRGNFEFKSSRNTTPEYAQPGLPGEVHRYSINLKLIADFGLIGLPNVGKSSLLNELTHSNAKVADYPFTTLEPNLGVVGSQVIADIPGLIEGASQGKGLGIKFLKHIEKVKLILHCISSGSSDVVTDYKLTNKELGEYDPELLKKEQIIILTKSDLIEKSLLDKQIKSLKKFKKEILAVSIHDWDSLEMIRQMLLNRI